MYTREVIALPAVTMRAAAWEDIPALVELLNICSQAMIGAPEVAIENLEQEWRTPGFDFSQDTRILTTEDGRMIGYIEVWAVADPPVTIWLWGRVHPEFEGQGLGTMMMEWAEERAREHLPRVPAGTRVAIQSSMVTSYAPAIALLEGYGMTFVRRFWRMAIELDREPPLPRLPEGITIRTFEEVPDARAVFRAENEAFKDHWGHVDQPEEVAFEEFVHHTLNGPQFDPSLWFLAMDGEEIAGVSLCRTHLPEDEEMGWLSTLGVRGPWRQKGLGLALLQHTFRAFHARGKKRVGLGVDASSLTGATRLYERAGMRVIRQFDLYEKVLQHGSDLVVRAL